MKRYLWFVMLVGCAGMQRSCTSCNAEQFGADWVVVQLDVNGRPFRCWELHNVSISNETQSDGIQWQASTGHMVHVSGFYNRVQVIGGRWDEAARELGLTRAACSGVRARVQEAP